MKKDNFIGDLIIIFAIAWPIAGLILLLGNICFKDNTNIKYLLDILGVFLACLPFYQIIINKLLKDKMENAISEQIQSINKKIEIFNDSIPYSELDEIEYKFGFNCRRNKKRGEIWIIANDLQETDKNSPFIDIIYKNITENHIVYYYVLPTTKQLASFKNAFVEKDNDNKVRKRIFWKTFEGLSKILTAEYYDIVLFIECEEDINAGFKEEINEDPKAGTINTISSEHKGYYCFSKIEKENKYFYQKIENDNIKGKDDNPGIWNFYAEQKSDFKPLSDFTPLNQTTRNIKKTNN